MKKPILRLPLFLIPVVVLSLLAGPATPRAAAQALDMEEREDTLLLLDPDVPPPPAATNALTNAQQFTRMKSNGRNIYLIVLNDALNDNVVKFPKDQPSSTAFFNDLAGHGTLNDSLDLLRAAPEFVAGIDSVKGVEYPLKSNNLGWSVMAGQGITTPGNTPFLFSSNLQVGPDGKLSVTPSEAYGERVVVVHHGGSVMVHASPHAPVLQKDFQRIDWDVHHVLTPTGNVFPGRRAKPGEARNSAGGRLRNRRKRGACAGCRIGSAVGSRFPSTSLTARCNQPLCPGYGGGLGSNTTGRTTRRTPLGRRRPSVQSEDCHCEDADPATCHLRCDRRLYATRQSSPGQARPEPQERGRDHLR